MNPASLRKKKVLPEFFYVVRYSKCKHPKGSHHLNQEHEMIIRCSAITASLTPENLLAGFKMQAVSCSLDFLQEADEMAKKCPNKEIFPSLGPVIQRVINVNV